MQSTERVSQLVKSMTLAEKVGQVFILTWHNEQQAINDLQLRPGGYVRIYSDAFSVARQTREIQQQSPIRLIIAADLERGIGGTIAGAIETVTCMALGATNNEKAAYDAAHMIGREAAAMGINMNYAPVMDVNNNPANPVINTRSFGSDPELVARLGSAFAKGLQDGGLAACGKHFPGHGNTGIDSHSLLGSVDSNRDELERTELLPFRTLIDAGIDAIMSAHLMVPALEPERLPATLSKRIMTDLLRHQLGFTGLAISDALDMKAVAANFPPEVAIPMAINAGCDQLIMPENPGKAVAILQNAVEIGEISRERLDEAVTRILTLKEKHGVLDAPLPDLRMLHERINTPEHVARAREIAAQSVMIVKDEGGILPLQPTHKICCITVSNEDDARGRFQEPKSFCDILIANGLTVTPLVLQPSESPQPVMNEDLLPCLNAADVVIIAAYVNVRLYSGTIELPAEILHDLQTVQQSGKDVILISFGSPYIDKQLPEISTYLCAFGATQPSQKAMADALTGFIVPGREKQPV